MHNDISLRADGRLGIWLGLALLLAGLSGHLFAAQAIGGYYRAYRDHIFGFFFLTTVSIVLVAGLGWKFWKGRQDISVLIVGALQAIAGLLIYIFRYHV